MSPGVAHWGCRKVCAGIGGGTQEGKSPANCVHSWRVSLRGCRAILTTCLFPLLQPSHFMELQAGASPAPLLLPSDAAGPSVERPWAAPRSLSAEEAAAAGPLCAPADYYGRVLLCTE